MPQARHRPDRRSPHLRRPRQRRRLGPSRALPSRPAGKSHRRRRRPARFLQQDRPALGKPALRLGSGGADRFRLVAAALLADLRPLRCRPPRSLHRLHALLGGARRRTHGAERPLATGAGSEALRGAGAGPAHRRGPRRSHSGGDRAARSLRLPRHEAAAVRLRHRPPGSDVPALQLRAQFGGVYGDARQRHDRRLVPRVRLPATLAGAVRRRAAQRAGVSGNRGRRPRDLLAHDPRHLVLGGPSRHRARAGSPRLRLGGAHEPARNCRGQLGMATRDAARCRGEGPPPGDDAYLRQVRAMKRKPWEMRRGQLRDDPQWYKDAILYELRVRSYVDSNGDGIGDFGGLTSRLDYLQDLGVNALWLLPICPSPGKDDGYDISDYTDVHPDVGTIDDFRVFVEEAHRRGIRVITELVLNHTSDQHPWFQRARRAPVGSPERQFYLWSDSPDRYKDARIIFKDFEPSNWSWDPLAKQYFWHRFFAHQPDLKFDNPEVHETMLGVVDFWFGLGADGLRLDAVPYLYERDGTNCENLPETHGFLKKLRAHVDERLKNRLLLAEANQR